MTLPVPEFVTLPPASSNTPPPFIPRIVPWLLTVAGLFWAITPEPCPLMSALVPLLATTPPSPRNNAPPVVDVPLTVPELMTVPAPPAM